MLLETRVICYSFIITFIFINIFVGGNTKLALTTQAVADLGKEHHITPTDDVYKYEKNIIQAKVKAIWNGKEFVEAVSEVFIQKYIYIFH